MSALFYALISTLVLLSVSVAAQSGDQGVIGAGGDFAYETGVKGALTNRNATNQLYTNALNYESQAWTTFPPNIRLLAKSFSMGRDGSKTNAQSEEFARASLNALNSSKQSGNFDPARFNMIDENQLKEWATVQNPIVKTARDRFSRYEKYGISLGSDKSTLKTPVGTLDLKGDITTGMLTAIASAMGYDPNDVKAGLQEGVDERNRILAAVTAQTEAELAEKMAAIKKDGALNPSGEGLERDPAMAAASDGQRSLNGEDPNSASATGASKDGGAASAGTGAEAETDVDALAQRQAQMDANIEAVRRKIGANSDFTDPIGRPGQNIFTMVHERYQIVHDRGRLMEDITALAEPVLKK